MTLPPSAAPSAANLAPHPPRCARRGWPATRVDRRGSATEHKIRPYLETGYGRYDQAIQRLRRPALSIRPRERTRGSRHPVFRGASVLRPKPSGLRVPQFRLRRGPSSHEKASPRRWRQYPLTRNSMLLLHQAVPLTSGRRGFQALPRQAGCGMPLSPDQWQLLQQRDWLPLGLVQAYQRHTHARVEKSSAIRTASHRNRLRLIDSHGPHNADAFSQLWRGTMLLSARCFRGLRRRQPTWHLTTQPAKRSFP
jgi:hypothetical protein